MTVTENGFLFSFTLVVIVLYLVQVWPAVVICLALLSGALVFKYRREIRIVIVTLPRDIKFVKRFLTFSRRTSRFEKDDESVPSAFQSRAIKEPNKVCFYFEDEVWTYQDVFEYSNRVAHVFQDAGYRHGDVIALFMENRPEFVAIWLGLSQLGCITALININLRKTVLINSLNAAKPKGIIYSSQLAPDIMDITDNLYSNKTELYEHNNKIQDNKSGKVHALVTLLNDASITTTQVTDPPRFKDKLLYIYTSGTTDMPKAAIILHSRFLMGTMAMLSMLALKDDDIIYNPLPLYHAAGGLLGCGPALLAGISVVLCTKFSALNYWTDCIKYKCTVGQYIGEINRYLLAAPPRPEDKEHKVRLVVGNGMRSAIWPQFIKRFNIKEVREFYGATEGNVNIVSVDNTVGAVGFIPSFLLWRKTRIGIIRIDQDSGEPIRDNNGVCIKCDTDEAGMFVGIISSDNPTCEYHGYVDKNASSKKVIHNVFANGDKAFLSGDILTMDQYGYLYFKDRTGDTFRWKGENVATAEVEAILSNNLQLRDVTVYGVEIPGTEGRAGMASIYDPDNVLNDTYVSKLGLVFEKDLPNYATPIFLRMVSKVDLTSTLKLKKVNLQKEGFNPNKIRDRMYFCRDKIYVPLTKECYLHIVAGKERL